MRVILNDFIGVRGRSGSSRGAALVATAVAAESATVSMLRPAAEPKRKAARLLNMLFWDFIVVPYKSRRADVVVHATNTGITIGKPRSVVVLHDTMVLDHPRLFNKYFVLYAKVCMGISVRKSWRVVTPSEHSKRQILLRWPQAEVRVIPWPSYSDDGIQHPAGVGSKHSPDTDTVLVVSSVDKHKRLPMAVEAVKAARSESGRDINLMFVTRPGNDDAAFESSVRSADPDARWIKIASGIDDETLSQLYKNAFCVLVSSIDEGFCLPALEASTNGIPVVHANRGALPEVIPREFDVQPQAEDDVDVLTKQILELADEVNWRKRSDFDRRHSALFSRTRFQASWASVLEEAEKS